VYVTPEEGTQPDTLAVSVDATFFVPEIVGLVVVPNDAEPIAEVSLLVVDAAV
jgi:hypothetical protein